MGIWSFRTDMMEIFHGVWCSSIIHSFILSRPEDFSQYTSSIFERQLSGADRLPPKVLSFSPPLVLPLQSCPHPPISLGILLFFFSPQPCLWHQLTKLIHMAATSCSFLHNLPGLSYPKQIEFRCFFSVKITLCGTTKSQLKNQGGFKPRLWSNIFLNIAKVIPQYWLLAGLGLDIQLCWWLIRNKRNQAHLISAVLVPCEILAEKSFQLLKLLGLTLSLIVVII